VPAHHFVAEFAIAPASVAPIAPDPGEVLRGLASLSRRCDVGPLRRDQSQREVAQRRQRFRRANASLSARVFWFTACIRIHALTASPKVALVRTLLFVDLGQRTAQHPLCLLVVARRLAEVVVLPMIRSLSA
jgi:hypothetical protein